MTVLAGELAILMLCGLFHLYRRIHTPQILMLHRVNPALENSGMNIQPERLEVFIQRLLQQNYQFLTMSKAAIIPPQHKTVVLTLDDGFADNHEFLWPLLKKYNIPATIYLATRLDDSAMLSPVQIAEMHASGLVEFGAHTTSHVNLLKIPPQQALWEIGQSRQDVVNLTGACESFAYPYGRYNTEHEQMVKQAGYTTAVSTRKRAEKFLAGNRFALPRISINGQMAWWQLKLAFILGRYKL